MTDAKLEYISASAVLSGQKHKDFAGLIEGKLGVCFAGLFSEVDVNEMVRSFYSARPHWVEFFEGEQYSLGESWYPYAEEGLGFEFYSQKTDASRALVEKYMPGLEKKIIDFLDKIGGPGTVRIRDGWSGPGIMAFMAGNHVSVNGGIVHQDIDSFEDEDLLDPGLESYSFVCMLQKPASGGNLTVWNSPYDYRLPRNQLEYMDISQFESATIEYKPGDLWMFNGLNPHNIGAFGGDKDRICLTFHIVKSDNEWLLWF